MSYLTTDTAEDKLGLQIFLICTLNVINVSDGVQYIVEKNPYIRDSKTIYSKYFTWKKSRFICAVKIVKSDNKDVGFIYSDEEAREETKSIAIVKC